MNLILKKTLLNLYFRYYKNIFLEKSILKLRWCSLFLFTFFSLIFIDSSKAQDVRNAKNPSVSKTAEKNQANPKPLSPQQIEKNLETKYDCEEFKTFLKEQKNRAQKNRQTFQNLSVQQRKLIEIENSRHEAEINKIMGIKSKKIGQNDVKSR